MLTQLTEELFRYSVIMTAESDGIKEPVIINNVLEECIAASYTALTERNIFPDIQMPQEKIIRNLDRSALARVFSNLLNNAVKYSDGDLKITCCVSTSERFLMTSVYRDAASDSSSCSSKSSFRASRKTV